MVACGAQARNAYCQAHNLCSANGNAIVAYADSLVQSVNNHELSEAEARRKWIEFRAARVEAQQQLLRRKPRRGRRRRQPATRSEIA